jgi:hypothetical protein
LGQLYAAAPTGQETQNSAVVSKLTTISTQFKDGIQRLIGLTAYQALAAKT